MGNAGRPRKPKAQKLLEGTYRKDRDNNAIKAPIVNEMLQPPDYLGSDAKKYFTNICGVLLDLNILSHSDIIIISQLAETIEINKEAYGYISNGNATQENENTGLNSPTGWFQIWDKTSKTIRELSNMLGLSPAARERIKVKNEKEEENDLTELIS